MNTYDANRSSIESRRNRGSGRFQHWQASEPEGLSLGILPDGGLGMVQDGVVVEPPPRMSDAERDALRPGREDAMDLFDDFRLVERLAEVDHAFYAIQTPAGGELAFKYFSYQKYDRHALWGEIKGDDFHRFDELAELGWGLSGARTLSRDAREMFGSIDRIADEGITPDRMFQLRDAKLSSESSEWTRDAMIAADDDALDRIRDSWNPHNATDHYKAAVLSTGDRQKIDRMNDCHASGLYHPELIEAVEFDKDLLLNLQEYTGPNQPGSILKLARNGHTPETVRTHGVRAALYSTAGELGARA